MLWLLRHMRTVPSNFDGLLGRSNGFVGVILTILLQGFEFQSVLVLICVGIKVATIYQVLSYFMMNTKENI